MLTEVEEVLIVLFLSDRVPSLERKRILNTDTAWKTVNLPIKELDTPPPMTKVMKGNLFLNQITQSVNPIFIRNTCTR